MALMLMLTFGITLADMKSQKANLTRILWKAIMPTYAIILLAWLASHAVSRVAPMPSTVRSAYLLSVSTAGNFTNNAIPIIRRIS